MDSQLEGTFTLLTAVQEVTAVFLQPLHLLQLPLFLLLLLLPLQPLPERLLRVGEVSLQEDAQIHPVTQWKR